MISPFDIFVFIAVLGVLIFVHELGHFAAAKACGVYVDRFSLGMPPRIFGFKYGETDYCLGLLPIGGYVKMAGQEDAPLSDEERNETYGNVPSERWFSNKPIWQRAVILFAGPFMNLVLAFFIYAFMAAVGSEVPMSDIEARVGLIEENSPASVAPMYLAAQGDETPSLTGTPDAVGWQTGDRIVSVNGKEISRFQDVMMEAVLGAGKTARVEIDRQNDDGTVSRYLSPIEPQILDDGLGITRFGFAPFEAALVLHVLPGTPAEEHGLLKGDRILRANGVAVDSNTFSQMVRRLPEGSEVNLQIRRNDALTATKIRTRSEGSFEGLSFYPMLNPVLLISDEPDQEVAAESEEFLRTTGLRAGERIAAIDGATGLGTYLRENKGLGPEHLVEVSVASGDGLFGGSEGGETRMLRLTMGQVIHALTGIDPNEPVEIARISPATAEKSGLKREDILLEIDGLPATAAVLHEIEMSRRGETFKVMVQRPQKAWGLVRKEEALETEITVATVQLIGVVWDVETVFKRTPLPQVIPEAAGECYRVTAQIGTTLARLFTGGLSPKLLGGPVMIGQAVTGAAKISFFYLLNMVALISVNLCVFNLLPLPVLDGGQLTFLAIEGIRRKPVSMKVMEAVQQVGILLIIGLIVYVTFNDVNRWFDNWLP